MHCFPVQFRTCLLAFMLVGTSALSIAFAQESSDDVPAREINHAAYHAPTHMSKGKEHKRLEVCPVVVLETCASKGAVVEQDMLAKCLVQECLHYCHSHHGGPECQVACGVLCCDAANDLTCLDTERDTCDLLCSGDCECRCNGPCTEMCLDPTCSPVDLQTCVGSYACPESCECLCNGPNCVFTCEGSCDPTAQETCDSECGAPCVCSCAGGDCTVQACPDNATCDPDLSVDCDKLCDGDCTCECLDGTCDPTCPPEKTCEEDDFALCRTTCGDCECEYDPQNDESSVICNGPTCNPSCVGCDSPDVCLCECDVTCEATCSPAPTCEYADWNTCRTGCHSPDTCVCLCEDDSCSVDCPAASCDSIVCDPECTDGADYCMCLCRDGECATECLSA